MITILSVLLVVLFFFWIATCSKVQDLKDECRSKEKLIVNLTMSLDTTKRNIARLKQPQVQKEVYLTQEQQDALDKQADTAIQNVLDGNQTDND